MTNETARREAKRAADEGFCGFCFASGKPMLHERDCKLVREHGREIGVQVRAES